jgi:hypothetical protein
LELSIFSQDGTLLGSFDIIEIDPKNPTWVLGWSCHPKDPMRVLGKYDTSEIALEVLDAIRAREDALRSQSMKNNVFVMPGTDGK